MRRRKIQESAKFIRMGLTQNSAKVERKWIAEQHTRLLQSTFAGQSKTWQQRLQTRSKKQRSKIDRCFFVLLPYSFSQSVQSGDANNDQDDSDKNNHPGIVNPNPRFFGGWRGRWRGERSRRRHNRDCRGNKCKSRQRLRYACGCTRSCRSNWDGRSRRRQNCRGRRRGKRNGCSNRRWTRRTRLRGGRRQ